MIKIRRNMKKAIASRLEKGQGLTELAISMTFLLILVAGVVDLGRAFFTYIALRDAAQEGASYGSYEPKDCSGIFNRVIQTSDSPINLATTTVDVTVGSYDCSFPPPDPKPCAGQDVRVTVTYLDFPITMPFLGTLIGRQTVDISATAVDNVLTPVCP